MPFEYIDFRAVPHLKGRQGKIRLHFLISDLNPQFKAESFDHMVSWLPFIDPSAYYFYPTGTLQKSSIELKAIVDAKYTPQRVKKKCEETEIRTTNKVLSAMRGYDSYRTKPHFEPPTPVRRVFVRDISDMSEELMEMLSDAGIRYSTSEISGVIRIRIKDDLFSDNPSHRPIIKMIEILTQHITIHSRQFSKKITSLSNDYGPGYMISPNERRADDDAATDSYGVCVPWSTIVHELEPYYHAERVRFETILQENEVERVAFGKFVQHITLIRMEHGLSNE